MAGEAREKCAVGGIVLAENQPDNASALLYETMFALQHRGDEASGMVSRDPGEPLEMHHGPGLVKDVYDESVIERLSGRIAVGHNRYSTSGSKPSEEPRHPQPVIDEGLGLAIGHNGNFPDTSAMDKFLNKHNVLYSHRNDSEKAALTIAQFMHAGKDLPDAIEEAYPMLNGAFSCVGTHDNMLVAFRDPHGIRPLALGHRGKNRFVSSETCGLDILNAHYDRDVRPGELVIIGDDGSMESRQLAEGKDNLDIFEFVYFARHDSELYGNTVNSVRYRIGEELASEHGPIHENTENTVVVPVPDTSVPEAEGYADALGLQKSSAIIKNRYIARTFMQPSDESRQMQLRRKHNIISDPVKGKDVILIDDSIVRLNTMPNLVDRLKNQIGAKSVSVLIGSPPVRFPDYYGIDTPDQENLAAANMTPEEMRKALPGCSYLGFLSLDRLVRATGMPPDKFNMSCFTGEYPIDIGYNKKKIKTPVSMEYVE